MKMTLDPTGLTPAETAELAGLESVFAANGGRGVEIAERIDDLRFRRDAAEATFTITVKIQTTDPDAIAEAADAFEDFADDMRHIADGYDPNAVRVQVNTGRFEA